MAPTGLTERSDRSRHCGLSGRDRPVGPTGLTGPGRVRVQLGFFIDLDLVIGFLAGQVHPPYKYKGSRPIIQPNRTNQIHLSFIVFTFPLYPTFPTSTYCSSLLSMAFEDILVGMPSLGQPYTCLPRRGPSRASVRRIVAVLHGDRSDRSL